MQVHAIPRPIPWWCHHAFLFQAYHILFSSYWQNGASTVTYLAAGVVTLHSRSTRTWQACWPQVASGHPASAVAPPSSLWGSPVLLRGKCGASPGQGGRGPHRLPCRIFIGGRGEWEEKRKRRERRNREKDGERRGEEEEEEGEDNRGRGRKTVG